MAPILEVKNLKKYFNTPRGVLHAVDDISFSMEAGTTLGIVGESGCGKSTLGRTILHLLDSTDGQIYFQGEDVTCVTKRKLRELRRDMQIIFQDPFSSLNPRMTVADIIAEAFYINGHKNKNFVMSETRKLMETVGLARIFECSYPHELDGGRCQRIGIARALALNPKFIVCDEPVSALDVSIQAQILNLLSDLQKEKQLSYIFVTHDLSVVRYISDTIIVMYLGQMVEMAPSDELFQNPLHPYTKALLSSIPIPDVHHKKQRILLQGEISSPVDPAPGCRFAARCVHAQDCCKEPQTPSTSGNDHVVTCCRMGDLQTAATAQSISNIKGV